MSHVEMIYREFFGDSGICDLLGLCCDCCICNKEEGDFCILRERKDLQEKFFSFLIKEHKIVFYVGQLNDGSSIVRSYKNPTLKEQNSILKELWECDCPRETVFYKLDWNFQVKTLGNYDKYFEKNA